MREQEPTGQGSRNAEHKPDAVQIWEGLWCKAVPMDFKKGQVLFYRGHLPYGVFVLVSGTVQLMYENASGSKVKARLPEFVPFGLDFVTMNAEYPCTAVAESDINVLFLPKSVIGDELK